MFLGAGFKKVDLDKLYYGLYDEKDYMLYPINPEKEKGTVFYADTTSNGTVIYSIFNGHEFNSLPYYYAVKQLPLKQFTALKQIRVGKYYITPFNAVNFNEVQKFTKLANTLPSDIKFSDVKHIVEKQHAYIDRQKKIFNEIKKENEEREAIANYYGFSQEK